jgi:mono/diheme cytochrome c family protein
MFMRTALVAVGLLLGTSVMAQGRVDYLENCSACHGRFAAGDGPLTGVLLVPVPDLRRISAMSNGIFPADYVYQVIDGSEMFLSHGDRFMPVWGSEFWLQEGADEQAEAAVRQRILNLLDFLASIQLTE